MFIDDATITVGDPAAAAAFYRERLGLPVTWGTTGTTGPDLARVTVGRSTLTLRHGPSYDGVHHLAFEVAPEDFETTLAFARRHLAPISSNGDDLIHGGDGWNSRSVYFLGPEGIVLEYIAREVHRGAGPDSTGPTDPADPAQPPRVVSLNEVGVGVPDVPASVAALGSAIGLPPYPPQDETFAAVGDPDGLLIVVRGDRRWFPLRQEPTASGPLEITVRCPPGARPGVLDLGRASVVARAEHGVGRISRPAGRGASPGRRPPLPCSGTPPGSPAAAPDAR